MAKKNVLQPGATIIPAAATLYCMGIEARTGDVCGFDFSSFNKYRWPAALLPLLAAGLLFDRTLDMEALQTLPECNPACACNPEPRSFCPCFYVYLCRCMRLHLDFPHLWQDQVWITQQSWLL